MAHVWDIIFVVHYVSRIGYFMSRVRWLRLSVHSQVLYYVLFSIFVSWFFKVLQRPLNLYTAIMFDTVHWSLFFSFFFLPSTAIFFWGRELSACWEGWRTLSYASGKIITPWPQSHLLGNLPITMLEHSCRVLFKRLTFECFTFLWFLKANKNLKF
jgi:hypothetical protein